MATKALYESHTISKKPSIFEVLASDSLVNNLETVIERIFQSVASQNPSKLGIFVEYFDEMYLIFSLCNHYLCLKHHSASFAEIFYGLKRVLYSTLEELHSSREILISVFLLSAWPYVRKKLRRKAIDYRFDEADGISPPQKMNQIFRKLTIYGQSVIHVVFELTQFSHYLAYMSGSWPYHSPLMWLAGVTLQRSLDEDSSSNSMVPGTSHWSKFMKLASWSLHLAVFSLQFLSTWNSDHFRKKLTSLPVPDAPSTFLESEEGLSSLCPICKNVRRVDTVLPVSGYIFCFRCIYTYVNENHCCPVTKYPASTKDLIRLFVPKS